MIVNPGTTADEFLQETQWSLDGPADRGRFAEAFNYMLKNVPITVLNLPDNSSPWTPGKRDRTQLVSWLQGIQFSSPVNAHEHVSKGTVLKQFRSISEPPGKRGNWYTLVRSQLRFMALPAGEYRTDFYLATSDFRCLFSHISDAFAGWKRTPNPYRFGGAVQYFIYGNGPAASALIPAKPDGQ